MRHGIYLRTNERNRENLRRIATYYQEQGVPFDPREGLDVSAVIRTRPDWAMAHGMVPEDYLASLTERQSRSFSVRFRALQNLGVTYALVGAYHDQIEIDREAKALRPRAKQPRLRLVYGLLRLDRAEGALAEARELYAIDPRDPRGALFLRVAREYARRRALLEKGHDGEPTEPLDAMINRLPLV
jgi:tetratricopeptide (TPR) repeat protein